jgi:hypothetical protein
MSAIGSPRSLGCARALVIAGLVAIAAASPAHADVVDDAYAAGNEAALAGDWAGAIAQWEQALELLPGRSAQLDYDLGTAYAQIGELGLATYHLQRALQPQARPTVEVAEAARRNLGIVRRRAEVAAEVADARISRQESWWDLTVAVLAGPTVAWISLISGWLLVLVLGARRWFGRPGATPKPANPPKTALGWDRIGGALALVLTLVFVCAGGLHGLAMEAADGRPDAIALDGVVELREGPGAHLPVAFRVQGGSRVRVLDERSGWVRVRLPAGLEGWAPRQSVARLDKPPMRTNLRGAASEAAESARTQAPRE